MALTTRASFSISHRLVVYSVAALATLSSPAVFAASEPRASEAPGSDSTELAAMPLEALMQVTVNTASRFDQSVTDAPAAVVVLTAEDIRQFGWRTLAEALASLPGLYVTNDRSYEYLGARGFQRPGDYNSRFLLLIDGMRTNDGVFGQAPIGTDFPLDMDLVKRIEYVPGPGSSVYGANALFGVINVITKNGSDLAGAEAAVAVGSYGEKKARASYGWHGAQGADILLSATSYGRSGQDLHYAAFDTPDQNHGVANRLDYDRAQDFLAKAAYGDFRLSFIYGNRTKGIPDAPYGVVFNAPFSVTDTHSYVDLTYQHALSEGVMLASQLYWGRYDYRMPSVYGPEPDVANVDGSHALWYGADVHATISSIAKHRIVIGTDFARDARLDQYNNNVDPYSQILDDHHSGNRAGVYIEDEITLPASFMLNAGLRYDQQTASGGNLSPRIGLVYKLTPRDTFKLLYGQAYRAPNAYEMYYAVSGTDGQLKNPSLKAEHIATTELVYERAVSDTGRATLSLFHYNARDLISATQDVSGLYIFRNVSRATARGAELAYEQKLAGARLRASYSYQIAHDSNTGAALQNSPRHLAKANLAVPFFANALMTGLEVQCTSPRLAAVGHTGGFCLANLTLGLRRLIRGADLSFSIYNLTDKRYADPVGPGFTQETVAQQSRTFLFKAVYGF
ncbi:TonB-dependent receptor plug domain-containing protein [Paraburkholderia rhynchosiae]|uniref:TonB-dependent receptor n=1 Tax=Paraburkholderia rhynchosiae TaxID=487049 RepID=A0A2N7WSN9_9BURK|nr:TonB-dependent receptor [Paraburkholderia rhynchosiae]PMS32420.1 TonB-dependent receptor [Paraburkholderia rhynchosiae]CAB3675829.1 Vitamin B12 transporter BtuB [Paraburkholderia rhynchosiae]